MTLAFGADLSSFEGMNTLLLQQAIRFAKTHELKTGQLEKMLEHRIANLHHSIQLPANNSVSALLIFIIRYIEHVPEFIEAVADIANDTGIQELIEPVIKVASEFFLSPPEWIEQQPSLESLMDKAYLAHRLIEEVNDRYMHRVGAPLVPMDMTRSNLIIHHLIGETFANQLDMAVVSAVNQIEQRNGDYSKLNSFMDRNQNRNISHELIRWPCLTDSLSINLTL